MKGSCGKYYYHWVYFIDLDISLFSEEDKEKFFIRNKKYKLGSPCIYVGETSKHPKKRRNQHTGKYKKPGKTSLASYWVKKYGKEGFSSRFRKSKSGWTMIKMSTTKGVLKRIKDKAKKLEEDYAKEIQDKGWGAWWN